MAKRRITENKKLLNKANKCLVGGVDSPVRSFAYVGGGPVPIRNGKGSKVYDYDGKEYIDYVLSYGAIILGHADPAVIRDLKRTATLGFSFGATNNDEVELARMIKSAIPAIEKIRFTNSGTEAVMGAIRLARGFTKRDKVLKFEGSYHGHADYLLSSSAGVPKDFTKHTIIAQYGDSDAVERIFKKNIDEIAAVIVEPVGGNDGVVPPDHIFLKKLANTARRHGALLIFDEVITGFRFNFGSVAREFCITPDIICLGKIIGGGLPVGAYGGSSKVMDRLAPLGDVYQASTFAGNPITMRSGISTLRALKELQGAYPWLEDLAGYLSANLKSEAVARRIDLRVAHYGNIFSLKFKKREQFKKFYRGMLARAVYLAPSEFEANFLSFSHTKKDIDKTINVARAALDTIL